MLAEYPNPPPIPDLVIPADKLLDAQVALPEPIVKFELLAVLSCVLTFSDNAWLFGEAFVFEMFDGLADDVDWLPPLLFTVEGDPETVPPPFPAGGVRQLQPSAKTAEVVQSEIAAVKIDCFSIIF